MEFKDVLRERLEIEFTKRLFTMIPSKKPHYVNMFRGAHINSQKCSNFEV
jgi:hypothetical protein